MNSQKTTITLRISNDTHIRLKVEAALRGVPMSEIVEKLLLDFLKQTEVVANGNDKK